MPARFLYIRSPGGEDFLRDNRKGTVSASSKSDKQLARVATNLAIGIVGLVIVRLIVQALPMFQEAGWIVKDKLKVVSAAVIVIDAMLLSVLVRFAVELRAHLLGRFAQIPGLGNMAASLVFLAATGIAYTDFKPVTHAWPSTKPFYLWGFFVLAAALLVQIVVLLFRDRNSMAALILHQPMPAPAAEQGSNSGEPTAVFAGR